MVMDVYGERHCFIVCGEFPAFMFVFWPGFMDMSRDCSGKHKTETSMCDGLELSNDLRSI